MSDSKSFIWAQNSQAHIKEPIEDLKQKGWRYGDVPTASNFNWLFRTLTQEIADLRKEISAHKQGLAQALERQAKSYENKLHAQAGRIDTKFSRLSDKHFLDSQFNEGVSRQICIMLREMEKIIRRYHKDFPELSWPLHDSTVYNVALANSVPNE